MCIYIYICTDPHFVDMHTSKDTRVDACRPAGAHGARWQTLVKHSLAGPSVRAPFTREYPGTRGYSRVLGGTRWVLGGYSVGTRGYSVGTRWVLGWYCRRWSTSSATPPGQRRASTRGCSPRCASSSRRYPCVLTVPM